MALDLQDAVSYVEAHGFGVSEEVDAIILNTARELAEKQAAQQYMDWRYGGPDGRPV